MGSTVLFEFDAAVFRLDFTTARDAVAFEGPVGGNPEDVAA